MATSGSEVEVECVANGGNPPPGLQWYIGGRRWEGNTEEINQETGVTVSRVKFPVTRGDDKKEVRCEVVHEALTDILEEKTNLEIHCKLLTHTLKYFRFYNNYFQISHKYLCLCPKTFPIIPRVTPPLYLVLPLRTPRPTFSGTEMGVGKLWVDKRLSKSWTSNGIKQESMFVRPITRSGRAIQRK